MPPGVAGDLQMTETQRSAARRLAEHSRPPVTGLNGRGGGRGGAGGHAPTRHGRSRSAGGGPLSPAHSGRSQQSHASHGSLGRHSDPRAHSPTNGYNGSQHPLRSRGNSQDRRSSNGQAPYGSHPRRHYRSQSEQIPLGQVFRQDDDVMSVRSHRSTYSRAPSAVSSYSRAPSKAPSRAPSRAGSARSLPPPVPVPEPDLKISMADLDLQARVFSTATRITATINLLALVAVFIIITCYYSMLQAANQEPNVAIFVVLWIFNIGMFAITASGFVGSRKYKKWLILALGMVLAIEIVIVCIVMAVMHELLDFDGFCESSFAESAPCANPDEFGLGECDLGGCASGMRGMVYTVCLVLIATLALGFTYPLSTYRSLAHLNDSEQALVNQAHLLESQMSQSVMSDPTVAGYP